MKPSGVARRFVIFLVKSYSLLISPFLGQNCRFYPSCSSYFITCVESFGVLKGSWLGFKRIFRCNPYNKNFGVDLPPLPIK